MNKFERLNVIWCITVVSLLFCVWVYQALTYTLTNDACLQMLVDGGTEYEYKACLEQVQDNIQNKQK